MHPWATVQLNYSKVKLLSREHLSEKPLDRILPLLAVSEELTSFAGLRTLYERINLLDPVYCCRDEALRMLEKCSGINDPQREQRTNVVMDFM